MFARIAIFSGFALTSAAVMHSRSSSSDFSSPALRMSEVDMGSAPMLSRAAHGVADKAAAAYVTP
jgi:hypothetical protein